MPTTPVIHQGENLGNSARVGSCLFVPSGLAFASADAYSFGDNKDIEMVIDKKVVPNFAESERQYAHKVTLTHNSLQGGYDQLRAAYLMTKRYLNAKFVEAATGNTYYYINNPTPAAPTGTTNLGAKFVYTHTVQDVVLQFMAQGQMSPLDYEYLLSKIAATVAGESGGATVGLSGSGYAANKFIQGNHRTVQIANSAGAGLIGSLKNVTFTLESFSANDTDDRDRFIHNNYRYVEKGTIADVEALTQGAFNTDVQEDVIIDTVDAIGRERIINNARVTFKVVSGNKNRQIDYEAKGVCCRNPNEAVPTSMSIGKLDPSKLELWTLGLT